MSAPIVIRLDDTEHDVSAHRGEPLAKVLRAKLGLRSVLVWCRDQSCGVCRVLIDGELVLACARTVDDSLHQASIVSKEHLESRASVQRALQVFEQERPTRCQLCIGAVAVTAAWLEDRPEQLEETLSGLHCSCTGRRSLRRALRG